MSVTITLKDIARAFEEAGLDPAVELVRSIKAMRPSIINGQPEIDANGEPVLVPVLPAETRAKLLLELISFLQPKLKAVEVKVSGELDMSSEQLDNRLKALLGKMRLGDQGNT